MTQTVGSGAFVWYDLMTSDAQAAQAFYTKVIGWGTQAWEGGNPYTMWTTDSGPIGGLIERPKEAPCHWLAYLAVASVDDSVARAQKLGANVLVPPTDIPTVGRFAVLADPQAAAFAVFAPAGGGQAPDSSRKPGNFSWHELMTTDYQAAFRFYEALFGWEKRAEHDMGPLGMYFIFGRDGEDVGGMFNKPPDVPAPPNWMQYIMVDSVEGAMERVKAHGGTVLMGPHQVPGGTWIAQCLDPQGAAFALHSERS